MAAIKNIDIRKGMVYVDENGQLLQCLDRDLNTPGNWRAILQLKVRNLKTGSITQNRVRPDDKVELAYLETREMQYSYREGENLILMDTETFEQTAMPAEFIGNSVGFLRENDLVRVVVYEGKPMSVELPSSVELKIIETEPSIKGATAAAQYKAATVETGMKIDVPSFINVGDVIEIDTAEGKYLRRSKA